MSTTSLPAIRQFKTYGSVAASFIADRTSRAKLLRGPVGSGKTVANIFDGVMAAAQVMPICRDGKIHCRDAIVGSTYGQIERNLYPSWHYWLPKDGGDWTDGEWEGGGGRFAKQTISFDVLRAGRRVEVNYVAIFAAIGELALEQFVRGFEPSMWYLFEVDQHPDGIIEQALGRLGRWPSPDMLPPGVEWKGYVRGDLNAPDIDSWYYKLLEEQRPAGITQYVQPSGLAANAEGIVVQKNPRYYADLAEQNKHRTKWVRRFVLNRYGPSDDGEPVYPEFSDDVHMARERLVFDPGRPLYLGFDQGLTQPACIGAQRAASGQWRILFEVVPGRMNGRRFAELVRQVLEERCPGAFVEGAWADPAGFTGADKEAHELAWAETVSAELGIVIQPAPTNEIDPRLTAVKDELTFLHAPDTPGLILSPGDTPMLRKGFASDYCYRMIRVGNTTRFEAKPDKTRVASNPHDALQYLLLGVKGRYGVVAGPRPKRDGQRIMQRDTTAATGCTIVNAPVVF